MPRRDVAPKSPARAALLGCATAVAVALTWLWPALGRGMLLYRDYVQVPRPVLGPAALGSGGVAPRAVPLDAVTAALAPVLPAGAQQQLLLLASVALAGCGVAVLLRRHGCAATVIGAALTTWSPYAAERLLLGQAPTLLGWAMIPWLVLAVREPTRLRTRLVAVAAAAAPAALTPWGGMVALATVVVAAVTRPRRADGRELTALLGLGIGWCLPWVVAGLAGASGAGERDGARAFAVRPGGPAGVLDVLTGGGVWAPAAGLASRSQGGALTASALLLAAAVLAVGWGRAAARDRRVLALALLVPPALALALATPAGLAMWGPAQDLPGIGLLRDTHRLLGLSTLALAVALGLGAATLLARAPGPSRPWAALGAIAIAISLAVVTAPDAPARLQSAYRPVAYPAGWQEAVGLIGDRDVLVLPWQPFRRQAWAGDQPFLDPLALALPGRAVGAHALTVDRDGERLVIGADDDAPARAWAAGDVARLRALGIEAVAAWTATPGSGAPPPTPPGATGPHRAGPLLVWLLEER